MTTLWREQTYLQITCAAMPLASTGKSLIQALAEVQHLLPTPLQRNAEQLKWVVRSKTMEKVLAQIKRMSVANREEQVARLQSQQLASAVTEVQPKGTMIRWTQKEYARLARRVRYLQRDLGDTRSVHLLTYEAQLIELPPERWRKKSSIQGIMGAEKPSNVAYQLRKITPLIDTLLADEPFDPRKKPRMVVEPDPVAQAEVAPAVELPPELPPEPPAEPVNHVARSLRDLMTEAGYTEPKAPRKPQERAKPPEPTLPPVSLEQPPVDPLEAFIRQGVGALRGLIEAISTHQAAHSEVTYRRTAEHVMQAGVEALDARIQQALPLLVQGALEKHFGPGMDVPRVELPPLKLDLTGSGLETRLKVDVVGLFPRQITEVKKALNGYADSVRFIEAGEVASNWIPRDVVLSNSKVSGRVVEDKCRKHGVHLQRVWGTSSAVVNAIRELYANQGIDMRSH